MALTLYYYPLSPPCRAVLTLLNLTDIPYDKRVIDILQEEQKSSEYLRVNPLGLVPAIQDDGYSLFESEAIMKYLINTRNVGQEYYPSDPYIKADIDKYMAFHHSVFSKGMRQYFIASYATLMHSTLTKEQVLSDVEEVLRQFQDIFLKHNKYIAGDQMTIADFFAIGELTMLSLTTDFDFSLFPAVKHYIDRCMKKEVINVVSQPLRDFAEEMKQTDQQSAGEKKKAKRKSLTKFVGFIKHKIHI